MIRIQRAVWGPLVEDEFVFGERTCFVTEEVVGLAQVLMQAVILNLALLQLVFCSNAVQINWTVASGNLHRVTHLSVLVDVLHDKDLCHLENN